VARHRAALTRRPDSSCNVIHLRRWLPLPGVYPTAARLLVVDDEPQIREFIARALTAAGYAIDFARSGKEGLSQATAGDYDLVILDLVMPDMDGREILARLRHEAARPGRPCALLPGRRHD